MMEKLILNLLINLIKSMEKITINCQECGKVFERVKKEFVRSQKIGRLNFCSRSCAGAYNIKIQIINGTIIPNINNIPIVIFVFFML